MAGYLVEDTRKVTTHRLIEMKQQGKKIAMLTSYDYTMAQYRRRCRSGCDFGWRFRIERDGGQYDHASDYVESNDIPCDFGDARCGTSLGRLRHAFWFLSG